MRHSGTLAIAILCFSTAAYASEISFTETFTGSGSLNGVNFTDQTITLTGSGDDANATSFSFPGGVSNSLDLSTVSVTIGSAAPVTLTDDIDVYDSTYEGDYFAFSNHTASLGLDSPAVADYLLNSNLSTSGPAYYGPGLPFSTSGGDFIVDSVSSDVTLTAVVTSATPEPSTLTLLGTGMLGIAGVVRRRFHRA